MIKLKLKLCETPIPQTVFNKATDFYQYVYKVKRYFSLSGILYSFTRRNGSGPRTETSIRNEDTYIIWDGDEILVEIKDRSC